MNQASNRFKEETRYLLLLVGMMVWILFSVDINSYFPKNEVVIMISFLITSLAIFNKGYQKAFSNLLSKKNFVYFLSGTIFILIEILNESSLKLPIMIIFLVINSYLQYLLLLKEDEVISYMFFFTKVFTGLMLMAILYAFLISLLHINVLYIQGKIYQEINILKFTLKQRIDSTPPYRLSSFFINPNTFGLFITLALSLQILVKDNYSLFRRVFKLANILVMIYALIRTGSRASQLFLLLFIFNCFIFGNSLKKVKDRLFKNWKYIFIYIIFLLIAISMMSKVLLSRGLSLSGRLEIWSGTLSILKGNFMLGMGSRNYNEFLLKNYDISHAHNSYIQLLGSGGILYLFTYLYIQYKIISNTFYIQTNFSSDKNNEKILMLYIQSFFISKLIYMLFENTVLMNNWFNYFTLFLIYILNLWVVRGEDMTKKNKSVDFKNLVKSNRFIYLIYSSIGSFILNFLSIFVRKEHLIFFISFGGVKIDDSPQVLLDAFLKEDEFDTYKFVLASKEEVFLNSKYKNNSRIVHVHPDTLKYYYYLLKSKAWITNTSVKRGLHFKARNTIHINTWHGTPLKKIGRDVINETTFQTKDDYSDVDFFTVQSKYDAEKFKSAFGINDEQILITGLPRNDILFNFTETDSMNIKRELKIPEHKKLILYAPTFRDYTESTSPYINIPKFVKKLDEDYYFLYRAHHSMKLNFKETELSNFKDVSAYKQLHELMIISDILISDYSSISVDYSILKRPILLYLIDLEEYQEKRGLYLDLEKTFYEHVFSDQNQIVEILNRKDLEKYRPLRFREKFIQAGGNSTEKIIEEIKKELL